MTRVNVIDPKQLTTKHLVSEYKEIMRLPGSLKRSLNRKGTPFQLSEIKEHFTLGKGHVKFFYNKMGFIAKRFDSLVAEMIRRGYNPQFRDSSIFNMGPEWNGDWEPDEKAIEISLQRINERLAKKKS